MDITIDTYYDKWDSNLSEFRKKLCIELGAKDELSELSHNQLLKEFSNSEFAEEIYKFSNRKWNQTHFDCIEAIKIDNSIVGISGCAAYKNSVRILMHRYSLLSARKLANTYTWHKNGVIDRHFEYAKSENKKVIFFTIYEHSKTLNTFSRYLRQRKSNKNKPLLGKFEYFNKPVLFNNVLQNVFYYKIDSTYNFNVEDIL
jgi:hypothetical protein